MVNPFLGRLEIIGHHQGTDHLVRDGANQVGAQKLTVLCVEDHLDEAVGLRAGMTSSRNLDLEGNYGGSQ